VRRRRSLRSDRIRLPPYGLAGGGFGDPWQRDPERVAHEVWNQTINAGFARERHTVVVEPESGRLDVAATAVLRRSRT
jgi:N-methylhydantoinase B/oxoprolinase/acetone carboxylase alpha subunit